MKTTSRTEKKHYAFNNAPRCGAKTKSNNGNPCQCPAVKNKTRCRIHGGAKGSGAKRGNVNAVKHGETTAQIKAFRQDVRRLLQESRELAHEFIQKHR